VLQVLNTTTRIRDISVVQGFFSVDNLSQWHEYLMFNVSVAIAFPHCPLQHLWAHAHLKAHHHESIWHTVTIARQAYLPLVTNGGALCGMHLCVFALG
jgi:hypothetical protein